MVPRKSKTPEPYPENEAVRGAGSRQPPPARALPRALGGPALGRWNSETTAFPVTGAPGAGSSPSGRVLG